MPHHHELTEDKAVAWVMELFRQPPGPWPKHWEGFPNVAEAFRRLFSEASVNVPEPPAWRRDRGVVICGGGWRFFPSIYVTVRMLRHVGCELPIQVWYLGDCGEYDVRMQWALDGWGVEWVCANSAWRERPEMRVRRENIDGPRAFWMIKPFAAAFSDFREVVALDADCYPAYNPETFMAHPEFQRVGAAFWPDQKPLEEGQWERFGIPLHPGDPALESGQYVVDKGRHWKALWLACWLNAYYDYVYEHVYGDKDTFLLAWRKAGHEMCVAWRPCQFNGISFVHRDFNGRPLFIHRTRDKLRWTGGIDGQAISGWYMTRQYKTNEFKADQPHEAEAHDFLKQSDELLRSHLHFAFRDSTWDRDIWDSVNLKNEYGLLREFAADDVIVDVGAHIGSFTQACLRRGAGRVHAVEPSADNANLFRQNTARFADRITLHEAAAWRSDVDAGPLTLSVGLEPANTGETSLLRAGKDGIEVRTIRFDSLILQATDNGRRRVLLCKLDCEGSEFPILYTSHTLHLIDNIVLEYHEVFDAEPYAKPEGSPDFTTAALADFLRGHGFAVEVVPQRETQGKIWAKRGCR